MATADVTVRDARVSDLPAIFAIYNEQVLHGTATFDTEVKELPRDEAWLTARDLSRHPVIVAELDGRVAAWGSLSQWSARCAYARAAEESVYVHEDFRGRGLGRVVLEALIERGRRAGLGVLLARIAEGNPASIALHERVGFRRIGTMRRVGEKFGRILDVELMDLHLDGG
ncbi:MAG: N-acetyltransferase family protein [Phycisphaerales bacterium]|nr:N-acetyltransferase family protein [Phycisphaerales bacterium]